MGEIDKNEARTIFREFVLAGGNFIDTAVNYQDGESEAWLGEFIQELEGEYPSFSRDQLVIATKFSINTKIGDPNSGGNGRKNMYHSIKSSLKRLGTDYVDILYIHVWDYSTSAKEVMRSFNDLVSSGLVRFLGVSDTPAWRVAQMNTLADQYGWSKFCIYQGKYNFGERSLDYDIRQVCEEFNIAITPWAILGAGKYTGRFKKGVEDDHDGRKVRDMGDTDYTILEVIYEVVAEQNHVLCQEHNISSEDFENDERRVTPSQVTIAWALNQPSMTSILVGVRKIEQLRDNIRALQVRLTEEQIQKLNTVSAPKPWFPFTFGADLLGIPVAKRGGRYSPSDWTLTQSQNHFNPRL